MACVCIHLAATWKGEDFTNLSSQRSNWWEYVDPSVTLEQLNGEEIGIAWYSSCYWCKCMNLYVCAGVRIGIHVHVRKREGKGEGRARGKRELYGFSSHDINCPF